MKKENLIKSIAATLGATFILATVAISVNAEYENPGDKEGWSKLTQEERQEKIKEKKEGMEAHRVAMDAIMEAGDYDAWAAAIVEKHPDGERMDLVTEENFPRLIEMHNLMNEGRAKIQEAMVIGEELGLPNHMDKMKKGLKRGMHKERGEKGECPFKN